MKKVPAGIFLPALIHSLHRELCGNVEKHDFYPSDLREFFKFWSPEFVLKGRFGDHGGSGLQKQLNVFEEEFVDFVS